MNYRIALDGPSGAGKSTIAKRLSAQLGFVYVDTGAMYRTIALYCLNNGIDILEQKSVCEQLEKIKIQLKYINGEQKVFLNDVDVSEKIRLNDVSMAASKVSVYKQVREFLLSQQRQMAEHQSVIMDGRDIGTVVLPNAEIKIFIVGDVKVRAKRRYKELVEKGQNVSYEEVLQDMLTRDASDINREQSPLRQAEDAILIDTTDKDLDQAYNTVLEIVENKIQKGK